jgi:hypothetical protein
MALSLSLFLALALALVHRRVPAHGALAPEKMVLRHRGRAHSSTPRCGVTMDLTVTAVCTSPGSGTQCCCATHRGPWTVRRIQVGSQSQGSRGRSTVNQAW